MLKAAHACSVAAQRAALQGGLELAACADQLATILMLMEQACSLEWQADSMGLSALAGQAVQQLAVSMFGSGLWSLFCLAWPLPGSCLTA